MWNRKVEYSRIMWARKMLQNSFWEFQKQYHGLQRYIAWPGREQRANPSDQEQSKSGPHRCWGGREQVNVSENLMMLKIGQYLKHSLPFSRKRCCKTSKCIYKRSWLHFDFYLGYIHILISHSGKEMIRTIINRVTFSHYQVFLRKHYLYKHI